MSVDGEISESQFEQLNDIAPLGLTDELRKEISAMRAITLIDEQTVSAIRAKYSVDDEMKLLRTRAEPEWTEYNDYVESCRNEGQSKKRALGL